MSLVQMNAAWRLQDLAPAVKLLLLALADEAPAGDHPHLRLVMARVCEKTSMDQAAVEQLLQELIARGLCRRCSDIVQLTFD